jgi:uncharacterized membrane protein (DUF485 family)
MSTETPVPPATDDVPREPGGNIYVDVAQSPEFERLRKALRNFVFPLTAAFLVWYALYVLLSAFARDFMDTKVVGHINIALVFGLLQFVTTFLIAWWYARYAAAKVDPLADELKADVEGRAGTPAVTPPVTEEAPVDEAPTEKGADA